MSPVNWATSGRIKIERAKEHLAILRMEADAFLDTNPYGFIGEDDVETGDWVLRAVVRRQPPLRFGAIAGDAVHNLACSLDALYGIVLPDRKHSYFPFCTSVEDHAARFAGHEKPSRQAAVNLLREAKAYPGGNDPLWLLNVLNNEDKHRTLIPCYGSISNIVETFYDPPHPSGVVASVRVWHEPPNPICPVEHGAEIHRIPAARRGQSDVDMEPQVAITIAFAELEVVKGKPIIPTLYKMTQAVDSVVNAFLAAGLLP